MCVCFSQLSVSCVVCTMCSGSSHYGHSISLPTPRTHKHTPTHTVHGGVEQVTLVTYCY